MQIFRENKRKRIKRRESLGRKKQLRQKREEQKVRLRLSKNIQMITYVYRNHK